MTKAIQATTANKNFKPIGWYLKEADALITQNFNASLESQGLTRFHWQVLKTISDYGLLSKKGYYLKVNRFITEPELENILLSLLDRGWLSHTGEDFYFTETGKGEFALIEDIQERNREKMLAGTNPEDYYLTLAFLNQVIQNLGGKVE
jgi:hypothetical protein